MWARTDRVTKSYEIWCLPPNKTPNKHQNLTRLKSLINSLLTYIFAFRSKERILIDLIEVDARFRLILLTKQKLKKTQQTHLPFNTIYHIITTIGLFFIGNTSHDIRLQQWVIHLTNACRYTRKLQHSTIRNVITKQKD